MSTPVSVTPPQRPRRSTSTNSTSSTAQQSQRRGNNSTNSINNMNRNLSYTSSSGAPMIPHNHSNSNNDSASLMEHMQRMIDLQYAQQQLLQQQQQQQHSLLQPTSPPPPPLQMDNGGDAIMIPTNNSHDNSNMNNTITNSSHHSAAAEAVALSPSSSTLLVRDGNRSNSSHTNTTSILPTTSSTNAAIGSTNQTIFHQNLFLDHNDSYGSFQGSFDSMKEEQEQLVPPSQMAIMTSSVVTGTSAAPTSEVDRIITVNDHIDDPGALLWRTSSERLLASFRHQDSQTYSPDTPSYSGTSSHQNSKNVSVRDIRADAVPSGGSDNVIAAIPNTTSGTNVDHDTIRNVQYRYDPSDHDVDHLISSTTQLLPTLNRSNVSRYNTNSSSSSAMMNDSNYPFHSVSYGSLLPATAAAASSSSSEPPIVPVVVSHSNLDALFVPPPPPPVSTFVHHSNYSNTNDSQQQQQQQVQDAILREFAVPSSSKRKPSRHDTSCIQHFCSCLYQFFYYCCLYPIQQSCMYLYYAESLHRSFCYGAIDGMLTGAGIVSTFCGMGLLSTTTNNSPPVRALVVVFTATTCFADAICMAIGHVWTTHIMYDTRSQERHTVRQQLFHNKSDAKGMLVDLLLSRGMLKIDAMSIADTLEGYPDLFINVLTGDALSAGGGILPSHPYPDTDSSHPTNSDHHVMDGSNDEHTNLLYTDNHIDGAMSPGPLPPHPQQSHRRTSYPSYGRLTEYEMDPDTYTAHTMTNESRKESCCMMMGFVLFAVVPSIIYTLVPTILFGPQHDAAGIHFSSIFVQHHDATSSSSSATSSAPDDTSLSLADTGRSSSSSSTIPTATETATVAMMMNPNTIIIVCTASIMWCLGVWKSRFVMSNNKRNWFIFGIETVIVLIICIVCAYGVGTVLNHTFLPNEYVLQVVQQQQQHVATKHHVIDTSTRLQHHTDITAAVVDVTSSTTTTTSSHLTENTMVHSAPAKTTTSNDDIISHPHHWYSF